MITALLAQLPAIHNGWELIGFIAVLLFQFYQSRQTQQLKGQVNGRLEELLHTTRARAHAEGHLAGVTYEQERKRSQLVASNAAILELANIKPATRPSSPKSDTAAESRPAQ
jgi:hypothetical protein